MLWFFTGISLANELDFGFLPTLESTDQPTFTLTPSADIENISVQIQAEIKIIPLKDTIKNNVEISFGTATLL